MHKTLVVDDNADIRSLLQQALGLEGYEIHQAENGHAAQKALMAGSRPCVIFLDLMMPVMDGNQFLAWKNQHPEYDQIPVVVISALAPSEELEGTIGYLLKPFDLDKVVDFVATHCG